MNNDSKFIVWDTISMAWTEIGLEKEEYPKIAKQLKDLGTSWEQVNTVAVRDVCGSFAWDTLLIFPCMLWMIMPDWGYHEEYLKEHISKREAQPLY